MLNRLFGKDFLRRILRIYFKFDERNLIFIMSKTSVKSFIMSKTSVKGFIMSKTSVKDVLSNMTQVQSLPGHE